MRKLNEQEQEWVKDLLSAKQATGNDVGKWLERVFFNEIDGRALIIQAKEAYAVLFLNNTLFSNEAWKNMELEQFFQLITFLRNLQQEGYIAIFQGKATRKKAMFFIQDKFVDPQPSSEKIILTAQGDYTQNPDIIYNQHSQPIYHGITFTQDDFELIISICTGTLLIMDTIEHLLPKGDHDKEHEQPVAKQSPHWKSIAFATIVLLSIGGIFTFLHFRLANHLNQVSKHQHALVNKLDSIKHHLANHQTTTYSTSATGVNQLSGTFHGVDISHWNGDIIDDIHARDDLAFVICKATEGTHYVDPKFHTNWEMIKQKGLIRGAYHFYKVPQDPIEQAEHFVKTFQHLGERDIAPILDIEELSVPNNHVTDPIQFQVDLFMFLKHVEKLTNRKPIVYTDTSFANEHLKNKKFAEYPLWLAEYTNAPAPRLPHTWKDKGYKFWQKSASYSFHSEKMDLDIYHGPKSGIYQD